MKTQKNVRRADFVEIIKMEIPEEFSDEALEYIFDLIEMEEENTGNRFVITSEFIQSAYRETELHTFCEENDLFDEWETVEDKWDAAFHHLEKQKKWFGVTGENTFVYER